MTKSKTDLFPEDSFLSGVVFDFFKPRSIELESYKFEASMTRQEFADDCDINTIMSRYEVTGVLPQVAGEPHYGNYIGVPNLMDALNAMEDAKASFMALPARVRREFDNDATQFVEFASDPKNLDQMRAWGLAPPSPVEAPKAPLPGSVPVSPPEEPKAPQAVLKPA